MEGDCFNTKFLVFNTQFLVFSTKFIVFNTKFIIFTHSAGARSVGGVVGVRVAVRTWWAWWCRRPQPLLRTRRVRRQTHRIGWRVASRLGHTSNCKMIAHFQLQNDRPFSIENHHFSGAILHSFCIFNRKFKKSWHLYCNLQYRGPWRCPAAAAAAEADDRGHRRS